jgi:putative flavoprotein involved in K+ transport
MTAIDTLVVGAGHAGLAVSRLLADAGHDHVVLDRGRVAERWRRERWDSFHLLTPNWMTRLPGWCYTGLDPEGFLSRDELVRYLERYAGSFRAPVVADTTVIKIVASDGPGRARFRVATEAGTWDARHVVVATGPHGRPHVPVGLSCISADIKVLTANTYRNPAALVAGGVLVVGGSASGVQIADELVRAGREVTLAIGHHTRMPRRYRGIDILWWMAATGRLARTVDDVPDVAAARRENSLQLVGRPDAHKESRDLDLGVLQARGVRLFGRLREVVGTHASFCADLGERVAEAETKMHHFLDTVDRYVDQAELVHEVLPAVRPRPLDVSDTRSRLDLAAEGISTVVVAVGYRPYHPWLQIPVLAPDGSIRQRRGVTPAAGLYVVGQYFQHRRDSGLIDGARHDARAVVDHLLGRAISRRGAEALQALAA